MNEHAVRLREQLAAIARAKAESAAEDVAAHLALPLEERLRRTVELSEQCISTSPHLAEERDDEIVAWMRVQCRLRQRANAQSRGS